MFEEIFRETASGIALAIEAAVVLIVAYGAGQAMIGTLQHAGGFDQLARRRIWVRFGTWILLALEFALAADIIRTAIAPSWEAIGQLAAIAAIRTLLNWFLMRDIEGQSREG